VRVGRPFAQVLLFPGSQALFCGIFCGRVKAHPADRTVDSGLPYEDVDKLVWAIHGPFYRDSNLSSSSPSDWSFLFSFSRSSFAQFVIAGSELRPISPERRSATTRPNVMDARRCSAAARSSGCTVHTLYAYCLVACDVRHKLPYHALSLWRCLMAKCGVADCNAKAVGGFLELIEAGNIQNPDATIEGPRTVWCVRHEAELRRTVLGSRGKLLTAKQLR
jgi:hypothetical protein